LGNGIYKINNIAINDSNFVIANGKFILNEGNYLFYINGKSNIEFKNVKFDLNNKGIYFIYIINSNNIIFDKCTFKNLGDGTQNVYGLRWQNSNNITISNCIFSNLNSSGVTRAIMQSDTANTPSKHAKIINNYFEDIQPSSDGDAIYIETSGTDKNVDALILGNTFVNCAKRYIKLNASGVIVSNNFGLANNLSNSMYSFVSVYGSNVTISNNEFKCLNSNNSYYGIEIGGSNSIDNILISNNYLQSDSSINGGIGIYITYDASHVVIKGNITKNYEYGIKDYYSVARDISNIKIDNNIFIGCSDHVINFNGNLSDVIISNNTSTDNITSRYFSAFWGNVSNIFINNNIHSCSYGICNIRATGQINNFNNSVKEFDIIGGIKYGYRTSPPTSGSWLRGDKIIHTSPYKGGVLGWICVADGTPGTWVEFGQVNARMTSGSPVGNLTPYFIGEEVADTTSNVWYKAIGTTSSDWVALN